MFGCWYFLILGSLVDLGLASFQYHSYPLFWFVIDTTWASQEALPQQVQLEARFKHIAEMLEADESKPLGPPLSQDEEWTWGEEAKT